MSFHATSGPYEYVAVVDAPSDEFRAACALGLAAQGNDTTLSMKAFTPPEFAAIITQLP